MALRDDASLSEMAWELEMKLGQMEGKLDNIAASQSRMHRKLTALDWLLYDLLGVILIVLVAMWAGAEFHWWYVGAVSGLGALYVFGKWLESRPWRREATQGASSDPA